MKGRIFGLLHFTHSNMFLCIISILFHFLSFQFLFCAPGVNRKATRDVHKVLRIASLFC